MPEIPIEITVAEDTKQDPDESKPDEEQKPNLDLVPMIVVQAASHQNMGNDRNKKELGGSYLFCFVLLCSGREMRSLC